MATTDVEQVSGRPDGRHGGRYDERDAYKERLSDAPLMLVLQYLGSLKLTVSLFAISLVLVMAGTIAQVSMNMQEVKQQYFTTWIAQLRFIDLVPFAELEGRSLVDLVPFLEGWSFAAQLTLEKLWVPFPGGALVGTLLLINLVAAKVTRFHARATGARLAGGLALLAAGFGLMLVVISSSSSSEGLQGQPPFSYSTLWTGFCGAVAAGWVFLVGSAIMTSSKRWRIRGAVGAVAGGILLILMLTGIATLSEPGLRILWQLIQGLGVAAVLMAGCGLIFRKQGGNVLLHIGVALMMIGQFAYGDRQLEQRLSLVEGEASNTLINQDRIELVFMQPDGEGKQTVTAVPASRLQAVAGTGKVISDPKLPFDIRVLEYFPNSDLIGAEGENPATAGIGGQYMVKDLPTKGGTTSEINISSAYVQLIDKESGEDRDTYLVSQAINDSTALYADAPEEQFDEVSAAGETYKIGLRFHRIPKSYWVKLKDVTRRDYSGSNTARDFASVIRLVDTETGEDRQERIWMNNPLRYRGETFYQSNYMKLPSGKELTGIQVVRNSGWLIPYLACSITGLGLMVHFSGTLNRYLGRRERERKKRSRPPAMRYGLLSLPVALVIIATVMSLVPWSAVMNSMRPERRAEQFDFYQAGEIPVQHGGRVMPLDAYARQTLKAVSKKESLPLENAPRDLVARIMGKERLGASEIESARKNKMSAMQWLMELSIDSSEVYDLQMVRIDAVEVLNELGLERRQSKLYTLAEIQDSIDRLRQITKAASKKDESELSFKEEKIRELSSRLFLIDVTATAMRWPTPQTYSNILPPSDATEEEKQLFEAQKQAYAFSQLRERMQQIENAQAPGLIPPVRDDASDESSSVRQVRWEPFSSAFFNATIAQAQDPESPEPMGTFGEMIRAYQSNDPVAFNQAVDDHLAEVEKRNPPDYRPAIVGLERWMESQWPTGTAMILYLIALLLGLVCLLVDLPQLRYGTWMLLIFTLLLHTAVIVLRIAITQRPPVINLYSSAVFIGWACVLYGLVVEQLDRRGIGNLIAAGSGALTLLVAYGLNTGDTMPVLQAVLDTDFWLGTHVISVTFGYAATFLAGGFGIAYLVAGWSRAGEGLRREIYRMTYGVTCFAILFSFVGTVLGGLWADDSWGRFWGWDPKENGALLIVIWNAMMLHARWDRMVGPKGFSMLAIGGNIVTAWSWFGTNQLGIGLHSYGFTSGTVMWLSIFVISQLALIAAAWLYWPRSRQSA
ncbi:MAG: cytochrome c biogenesis protein CcsA [Pirellulaceae bacterium]